MDEAELDRIDMCHVKYTTLIGKQKYLTPLTSPDKILDLGCGTGRSLLLIPRLTPLPFQLTIIYIQEFGLWKWRKTSHLHM